MRILLSIAATSLQILFFGMLLPFLQILHVLPSLGGHGLANMGYIFYGAFLGFVIGATTSFVVIFRNRQVITAYFAVLAGLTALLAVMLVGSVVYLGVHW